MSMAVAQSIRRGLQVALASARGDADKRRYRVPCDLDLRAIRNPRHRMLQGRVTPSLQVDHSVYTQSVSVGAHP
ncbi:MAG: hypothetical protein HY246_06505 [Proteobacteria bacterium]|nr:hypothetical protein [Pseudomonadota bacterium]